MERSTGQSETDNNDSGSETPGSYFYNPQASNWALYRRFNESMRLNSYPHPTPSRRLQHRFIPPGPYQGRRIVTPPLGYSERNRAGLTFSDDGEALIDGLAAVHQLSHPMRTSYYRRDFRNHWTFRTRYSILPIGNYYRRRQWYPSIDTIRAFDRVLANMESNPRPSQYTPPGPPRFNAPGPSSITAPGPSQFTASGPFRFTSSGPPQWNAPGPSQFNDPGPFPSTSYEQRPGLSQRRKNRSARWRERRAARRAELNAERRAARQAEMRPELTAHYPYTPWVPVSPAVSDVQEQTYESNDFEGFGDHSETQLFDGVDSDSELQIMAQLEINDESSVSSQV